MREFKIRAFLRYVLLRTLFVLVCLTVGLLGWPGATGAQDSLLNGGQIDASGARRITVTPSESGGSDGIEAAAGGLLERMFGSLRGGDADPDIDAALATLPEGMLEGLGDLPRALDEVGAERDKALERAGALAWAMEEIDSATGNAARAERLRVEAETATRPATPAEQLFLEFGEPAMERTPYEVSRAASMARR